ncbi:hypothetical protein GCM10007063_06050 [Lentibacillus kapialis]|uniref:IrrE N-terminal-like domain-containing protein n=1 Tax=Lentibacillus kapialis TaxID=340214 RepID=A0A917PPD8_9BACI|nr:ImmA/IrrE family metallo-endopeptidase [Lentibacillus kapialis]GGJ86335.1 hypothetical protein GCM10007063_06050 [Lentibacillus kapialis]
MNIKRKVGQLVKKHGTNNPFVIAKEKGILIRRLPLGSLLGYHTRKCRVSIIHINEDSSQEEQLFTCCHELGHAVLHPEVNTSFLKSHTYYSTDKIEQEANLFAVELLFQQGGGQSITIKEAIEQYGIPEQLLIKIFYH